MDCHTGPLLVCHLVKNKYNSLLEEVLVNLLDLLFPVFVAVSFGSFGSLIFDKNFLAASRFLASSFSMLFDLVLL